MVFVKPYTINDAHAKMTSPFRSVVKRDGVAYENKYFAMSAPEAWNVVYNLKAKLGKDKYRIQFKDFEGGKDLVVAQAENFDEAKANWDEIESKLVPQFEEDAAKRLDILRMVDQLRQGNSRLSTNIPSFRKASTSDRLRKDRERFEEKLRELESHSFASKTLNDYKISRTLGTGSFGRVLLAQDNEDKNFYAIKVIKKQIVIKLKQVEHTTNEKNILACITCPFVINLSTYFQDKKNLYFVIEYINGGEMFTHIHRKRHFDYETARFFAAEVVLAFEYLHNLDICYRDLKPENLLIDKNGHVRVTDFGFAKRVTDRTWTLCGTPEYLAPEIILSKGYAHAVDWWAVGVLVYEMRAGHAPFYHANQMEMYRKIVDGTVVFPGHFQDDEKALISGLLQVDLSRRLGNMKSGVDDIKKQKIFTSMDWDALYRCEIQSPFVPKVSSDGDSSNFDRYDEEKIEWCGSGDDPYEHIFKDF